MDQFSNPIVTSRVANDHFNDILVRHADIVSGINNQAEKVKMYQDHQGAMAAQNTATNVQMEKDRMASEQKDKELELKRLALQIS